MTNDEIHWAIVDRVSEEGVRCEGCSYDRCWEERHPYGSTYATEFLRECTLGNHPGETPEMCPGFEKHLDKFNDSLEEQITKEMESRE